jgi:elongation factor G
VKLKAGAQVLNPHEQKKERVGKILQMHANKREELQSAGAGDIVAITGFKVYHYWTNICAQQNQLF